MAGEDLQNKATEFHGDLKSKLDRAHVDGEMAANTLRSFNDDARKILENTALDPLRQAQDLDHLKRTFDEVVRRMSLAAGAELAKTGEEFVSGVEEVAAAGPTDVEAAARPEVAGDSAEGTVKKAQVEAREKRRAEFAKNQKGRDLQSALRAVKKTNLEEQKKKYDELKNAGMNSRNGLLDGITDLKRDAVKAQLEVYKQHGVDLEKPVEEHAQAVNALKGQLAAFDKKSGGEEPDLNKLQADAEKASQIIVENKVIVLEGPPTMENVANNFAKINEGQANIEKASAFLQASFAESSKLIAKGKQAADDSDLWDSLSPWKTDNNDKVDAANGALKELQKNIRREYSPLIVNMEKYKGTVLAAAEALQGQTKSLHGEKSKEVEDLKARRERAVDAKKEQGEEAAVERKDVFDMNIDTLKQQHEAKLKQIREKKAEVMKFEKEQAGYVGNQKAILDEHGQQIDQQRLTHEQAGANVNEAILLLQDKLKQPGLNPDKRRVIEERIAILQAKKGEIEQAGTAFVQRITDLGAMQGQLMVAGENVYDKAFFALNNLDQAEKVSIVDFAQQITGMERQFAVAEAVADVRLEEDVEALSDDFEDKIEIAQEEEKITVDLDEQADLHRLELEVANMAVLDNLKSQRDQLMKEEEVGSGILDTAWNTITFKRVFTLAYDAMGLGEDNWFRKHVNGLGAPFTIARDGIEAGFGWLDEKLHISDGYHWLIEKAKAVDIPVIGQAAEIVAGVTDFVVDLGAGVSQFVLHPIDSAKGIIDLVTSPSKWKEVGKALIEYDEFGKGNGFFAATKVLGNVLLTATGVGAVGTGVKVASAGTNVASKIGRFVQYTAIDFAKNAPRALLDTGKFIVVTPFKIVGNTLKLATGAMKVELPKAAAAMRNAARINKVAKLQISNNVLAKQLAKMNPMIDQARLDAALAAGGDLSNAMGQLKSGLAWPVGVDDAARVYAEVVFARYFNNAQRITVLSKIDAALSAVKDVSVVPAAIITEAAFNLGRVGLDEYAKLVKRYKNADDLAAAILMDGRFGLKVGDVSHVAQAKGMAKMLTESGGEAFRRYLKTVAEPVAVDDLIKMYSDAGKVDEVAKLGEIKAGPGIATLTPDVDKLARYSAESAFVGARSLEELMMKILDDMNVKEPMTKTTGKGKKKKTVPVSHFDDANSIQTARAYAKTLFADRAKILPTDLTALTALKNSLTDVKLLEAIAPSTRQEGLLHAATNKVEGWRKLVAQREAEIGRNGVSLERKAQLQSEIQMLNFKIGSLQTRKVHMLVSWPLKGVGKMVVGLGSMAPEFAKVPFKYAWSAVEGGFVFTLDSSSRLASELKTVIQNNRVKNSSLAPDKRVGLLNGAGEIEFVAKNAQELNAALRKMVILSVGIDKAEEKGFEVDVKNVKAPTVPDKRLDEESSSVDGKEAEEPDWISEIEARGEAREKENEQKLKEGRDSLKDA